MDSLATVVESMTRANKALREVIESSADEVGQLEKFEDHFRFARERFLQFKQTISSNNHQADELIARLEQSLLEKRKTVEDVRRQIGSLRREKMAQDEENKKLERALDDNVDSLKTINISGGNLVNAHANGTPRGKIIDRLREDMAK